MFEHTFLINLQVISEEAREPFFIWLVISLSKFESGLFDSSPRRSPTDKST